MFQRDLDGWRSTEIQINCLFYAFALVYTLFLYYCLYTLSNSTARFRHILQTNLKRGDGLHIHKTLESKILLDGKATQDRPLSTLQTQLDPTIFSPNTPKF